MKPAGLLIIALAVAVIANARVALAPGWVVPVPVVFLVIMIGIAGMLAAVIVLRLCSYRFPVPAPSTTSADKGTGRPAAAS